jgi:hypothetical protein
VRGHREEDAAGIDQLLEEHRQPNASIAATGPSQLLLVGGLAARRGP